MRISEQVEPSGTVLHLQDRFDFGARAVFKDAVEKAHDEHCLHLIVDLGGVTFMDSSALGLLVVTYQNFKRANSKVSLLRPQGYVRQVLDLANIPNMMKVYENESEALAAPASDEAPTPIGASAMV